MKRPIVLFFTLSLILALIFFTLPINLFDGQILMVEPHREYTINTNLSLSYFIGLGYNEADMANVKDFYLTTKGIFMAVIFIVGMPGLLAYRMHIKQMQ
ncbi:MAG: hypothetical protein QNK23_00010 [Crocinitomicaceae bacterium]|nr:hypothetical protein [Crocinitomicaceae bacterium]